MLGNGGTDRIRATRLLFGRCLDAVYNPHDGGIDILDLAHALHGAQLVLLPVIVEHRQRLGLVDAQAVTDGFLVVIAAMAQPPAALVTAAVHVRWRVEDVVHGAAAQAGTPADQALDQCIHINRYQQCQVDGAPQAAQQLVERLRLLHVTGKSIKNESVAGIRAGNAFMDDAEHDFVADQLAGIHGELGLTAQRAALGYRLAQHVAGRDLRQLEFFFEQFCLGTLAGTGRTQQYDPHNGITSP